MLDRLHEHISQELNVNTRTDTIFVVTGIIFNFIMLAISWPLAFAAIEGTGESEGTTLLILLIITMALAFLINSIAVIGLLTGRATRAKLMHGLVAMYKDADVDKYYDESLVANYMRRYVLFVAILGLLGLMTILIPLVVLITYSPS